MRWHRKVVRLSTDLRAEDVGSIMAFVGDQVAFTSGYTRIWTSDADIENDRFADAWAEVRPGDRLRRVTSVRRHDGLVATLEWRGTRHDETRSMELIVRGTDETQVLGLAEATRRYVRRHLPPPASAGGPGAEVLPTIPMAAAPTVAAVGTTAARPRADRTPARRRTRLASWCRDLSVEVVGGLLVLTLASLASALWLVLH
jgi:hypothetical protein